MEDSSSKRFSTKLSLQPAGGLVVEKVFQKLRFQLARRLVVEKVFQQGMVTTRSRTRRKGFSTSKGCNQREDSSTKRFSNQPRGLRSDREFIVEKIFQQAKVATSSRARHRNGFPISQGCKKLEDGSLKRFSNQQKLQPT